MSVTTRAIATARTAPHLRRVSVTRLIRFLTILTLVLSPLAMLGAAPASAAAHHAAMAADSRQDHRMTGHDMVAARAMPAMPQCQGMEGDPEDQPCGSVDCLSACPATPAIPAEGGRIEPHNLAHGPLQQPALAAAPPGLVPEAEIPPPRTLLKI